MWKEDNPGAAEKAAGPPAYGTSQLLADDVITVQPHPNFWTRTGLSIDSFRKAHYGSGLVELERPMKSRHLNMIAIGGSIGAGFFVGSGSALATGGPGFILIDFLIIGVMMFNVVHALGELAVMYPVSGSFYFYSSRFIDPSWGFAMGWNYVFQWASVLPLELTICGITIQYWSGKEVNIGVWITIFLVVVIVVNLFGAIGYAEEEYWSAVLKLGATVVFMLIALVLVCGGGPSGGRYDHYWGARLWHPATANPAADPIATTPPPPPFKNGFNGFCAVFVTAAFSFSGTELVGLAAAETANPIRSLPGAIKQVFWRITLFYILGLFFVGLLIRSDDPQLLNSGAYGDDPQASPFVLVGKYAGLKGFDHFMNVIILVSVLSISVSGVYGGSRTLLAMAQQGYAPRFLTYIDKSGRPLPAVVLLLACGLVAFVSLDATGPVVFNWLQAISGLAALFTWGSICLAHIRFRHAWKHHGHSVDEIPFRAAGGIWGSYLGVFFNVIVLMAQFYTAVVKAVHADSGRAAAEAFFQSYLAAPVILCFWTIGYFWKREGILRTADIDVDTGRRELDWEAINAYRAKVAAWPRWRRIAHMFI